MAALSVQSPTDIYSSSRASLSNDMSASNRQIHRTSTDESDEEQYSIRGRSSTPGTKKPQRPKIGSRKSSGTIIVSRDSPTVEMAEEHYDADDARAMSPRRSNDEVERMGDEARQALEEQAKALQDGLLEIIDRVDTVKSEHEKLEGGNKFLQSYIGELMQTSKITSAGAPKAKGKSKGK